MHLVARRAAEFGVEVEGQVRFRLDQAVARKDSIVKGIHKSIYGALDRRKEAIDFLRGEARFLNEHEIETGDGRLSFEKAIVATGARRVVPPIPGLEDVEFLTNRTALELNDLPSSMIIVGGGYVGIEFAQMYGRFGTRVTLLGRNSRLAPTEDPDLAQLLAGYLREEDIQVYTNAPVTSLRKDGHESVASAMVDGEEKEFRAEVVLLAAGRVGNTDRLDLEAAGVATLAKGFVQVDDRLTTSQPNISAIGDVKGGWMFTHVATYDGPIAALNAVKGAGRSVDYRVVPRVIFSDPALAAVGLTETEASEQGYDVAVGSVPVQGARSLAIGDGRGRLKAVVNRADGEILGFHILAPHGDDLLHEVVAAMHDHGRIERIGKSVHAHPTLSEMVKAAAKAAN
ncbi:MAG: NAD(P)/FAD-dependent oxidoreductase [Gemmatimonadetes bacterium]|nr:NAD(P)/FAD-dependent oxidoreductase [Gemmatimonadota bacterium]